MKNATRVLAAAILMLCAGGCASSDDQSQQQQNPNASSIPWNRPQSWESQGMLGGFQQPEGSTGH
ncbi:MAG: hypothetical protein ABSE62_03750 [Chthoniobacteraceae bacterium]|jgi:hypothetical protein